MISMPTIILVSPMGPLNVGGVARLMGNFGCSDLRIVDPRCNLKSLEAKQMSMRSYPILESAKIFSSLREAQSELQLSVALSGRLVEDQRPSLDFYEFMHTKAWEVLVNKKFAFVFGREESGLRLEELSQCDWQLEIPVSVEMPSINLTSAAAIVLSQFFYEKAKRGELKTHHQDTRELTRQVEWPTKNQEEAFFERLYELLDRTKFLNPQNPKHLLEDLKALYHRAQVNERDIRVLFGILQNIQMTLDQTNPRMKTG